MVSDQSKSITGSGFSHCYNKLAELNVRHKSNTVVALPNAYELKAKRWSQTNRWQSLCLSCVLKLIVRIHSICFLADSFWALRDLQMGFLNKSFNYNADGTRCSRLWH